MGRYRIPEQHRVGKALDRELGPSGECADHPGENRANHRPGGDLHLQLLVRLELLGPIRVRSRGSLAEREAHCQAGAVSGTAPDLEAVRKRGDQRQAEAERGLVSHRRARLKSTAAVADLDLERFVGRDRGYLERPVVVLVGVQNDVVAGLGDRGLEVVHALGGGAERLAQAGHGLAHDDHVLRPRGKDEMELALTHEESWPEWPPTSVRASSRRGWTGSSRRSPVISRTLRRRPRRRHRGRPRSPDPPRPRVDARRVSPRGSTSPRRSRARGRPRSHDRSRSARRADAAGRALC